MIRRRKTSQSNMGLLLACLLTASIAAACQSTVPPEAPYVSAAEDEDTILPHPSDDTSTPVPPPELIPAPPVSISDNSNPPASPGEMESDPTRSDSPDELNSSHAILIRLDDGATLLKKNSEERVYPASLTKIMTAIVAIENLPDLQEPVELTHWTFADLYSADAVLAGFQPGDSVRAIDLLYGMLLPSGAEACIALADHIAGSEQAFIHMMNQKAQELGMTNTHFENATGVHGENHYTTVQDLSILLRYSLQNATFRGIFTSPHHTTHPTNSYPDGLTFYSSMFAKLGSPLVRGGEILGGKTGYTEEAGLCLASLARVDNQEYILITVGAEGDTFSEQRNITDAVTVYSSIGK